MEIRTPSSALMASYINVINCLYKNNPDLLKKKKSQLLGKPMSKNYIEAQLATIEAVLDNLFGGYINA